MKIPVWLATLVGITYVLLLGVFLKGCYHTVVDGTVVMEYDGCKVIKTEDDGTPIYLSICDDRSAVSWQDEDGKTRHTISERK